ncbi:MAG: ureidoglycolate lyase [Nitratireductor sp.]
MTKAIIARPLTREVFAPFGEVIEKAGSETRLINNGMCTRYHDLATVEIIGEGGRPSINIFAGKPYIMPLMLEMVERHPLGSQAFIPMHDRPFLVVVCPDEEGRPGTPSAFITKPGQGVSFPPGQWHGVLTPLDEPGDFVVVDRAGDGNNLEEYYFDEPWRIELP